MDIRLFFGNFQVIDMCIYMGPWRLLLTLIAARLSGRRPIHCGMKLRINSQASTVQPMKFGNG